MTPRELADMCEAAMGCNAPMLALIARTLRDQADEIDRLQAQIERVMNWKHRRDCKISELKEEIARLKHEMSVHDTPDGGMAGMLSISPEAAKGLMQDQE